MKKNIILAFLLIISFNAFTQQLQTSSLYDLQGIFHNPSTAGVAENNYVGASYRTQWSGISGRPKTATIFGSFDLPNQKMGVGGYIYNDKTGPTARTGIQIAIAKHIPLADDAKLSFGIESRLQQFSIDKNKLQQTLGNDPVLGASENNFKYDAGLGVSYTGKRLQIGVSVSQLIQSKLDFYSGNLTRTEQARLYRHFYAHAQYKWVVDDRITITPNVLWIYLPNAPLEFQGGVRVEHKNFLWWGLSARARQSFMLSAGLNVTKNLSVGYSFDIYRTPLSIFEGGSNGHEFLLRYNFVR